MFILHRKRWHFRGQCFSQLLPITRLCFKLPKLPTRLQHNFKWAMLTGSYRSHSLKPEGGSSINDPNIPGPPYCDSSIKRSQRLAEPYKDTKKGQEWMKVLQADSSHFSLDMIKRSQFS